LRTLTITDVRSHPGDSAFLLDDGQTAILYDSGFGFTGYCVAENIRRILGSRPLDYIFLTHSHYDHALGSAYVRRVYPQARVVAGEYAASIFQRPSARQLMIELDRKFAQRCGAGQYEDLAEELTVHIPVKDGQRIDTGGLHFTAIALPGHTKCSVGYYLAEQKLLLSTETLGVFNGGDAVVPSYLVGYKMTLDSMDKAAQLDIAQLLLPHYGLLDREKTGFYLCEGRRSAVQTAETITGILGSGGTQEDAVAWFQDRFWQGPVRTIYPIDAMELNTRIMVELIRRELLSGHV